MALMVMITGSEPVEVESTANSRLGGEHCRTDSQRVVQSVDRGWDKQMTRF